MLQNLMTYISIQTAYVAKPHLYLESKKSESMFSSETVSWLNLNTELGTRLIRATLRQPFSKTKLESKQLYQIPHTNSLNDRLNMPLSY